MTLPIFPEHAFQEISGYYENLIALTPTQHFTRAHPQNRTSVIDPEYQELLLKAKAKRIDDTLKNSDIDHIYSFQRFSHVLRVGFSNEHIEEENANYITVMNDIQEHFS